MRGCALNSKINQSDLDHYGSHLLTGLGRLHRAGSSLDSIS